MGVKPVRRRGVALLFVLSTGVILVLLSGGLLSLYFSDAYSQGQQQQSIQAYWNARSGLEKFSSERTIPKSQLYVFGERGDCRIWSEGKDVYLEGRFGKQKRKLLLRDRNPAHCVEVP